MYALYATAWTTPPEDPTEERNRFHRIALHEARIASDWRTTASREARPAGLLDRVRAAIGIAPAQADCVACSA
jgi:hypothetical protein